MYGNECKENRGKWNKESQIFGHRLLDVGDPQEHHCGIQIDQPIEPIDAGENLTCSLLFLYTLCLIFRQ